MVLRAAFCCSARGEGKEFFDDATARTAKLEREEQSQESSIAYLFTLHQTRKRAETNMSLLLLHAYMRVYSYCIIYEDEPRGSSADARRLILSFDFGMAAIIMGMGQLSRFIIRSPFVYPSSGPSPNIDEIARRDEVGFIFQFGNSSI